VAQHYGRNGLPIICELWDEKNPASKKPKNEGATLHTYGQLYSPDASGTQAGKQILKGLACLSTRSGEFSCILLMQCGTQAGKPNFERACLLEYQIRRV